MTTFDKVPKMFNGEVDGQEFPVESAVASLSRLQGIREIREWLPLSGNELLEHCSYCRLRGVCHDARWCTKLRVYQQCGICKGLLKADVAASLQMRVLELDFVPAKSRFRGWRRVAQQGMKRR